MDMDIRSISIGAGAVGVRVAPVVVIRTKCGEWACCVVLLVIGLVDESAFCGCVTRWDPVMVGSLTKVGQGT
jgi:hypothetical protein